MQETYLDIMIQSLKKKSDVLNRILDLNKKQKEQLENPDLEPDDFDKTVEAKAACIEQLELLDQGFDKLYENVREELQGNKAAYADKIKTMQSLIREVTDKSVEIQAGEQRNKDLMTQKFANVRKQLKEVRTSKKAANQYYQNMMKMNYVDPQFMDNKK